MDEITLKYGNGNLTLKKSQKLMGIKPLLNQEEQIPGILAANAIGATPTAETLGGFQLITIENSSTTPMEDTLEQLRTHANVQVGTHVFHTSDDEVPFVPTGKLFLRFSSSASNSEIEELLAEHKLQIVEAREARELIVQVTPASENPVKVATSLQQSGLIEIAEPDLATPGRLHAFVLPQDTLLNRQWHLQNTGFHRGTAIGFQAGADARVLAAWQAAQTIGNPNVVVAVIDDGFDLSHPDLAGIGKIIAPMDFTRSNNHPIPELTAKEWHGTACAGVAIGNVNGSGVVGASPGSRLMPVRWGPFLSDDEIERWFSHVTLQGAWVVSCSWGARARRFELSARAAIAIKRCATQGRSGKGCVVVFAAGNEDRNINDSASGSINGFAIHPNVIAVAASTSLDQKSDYSNYGQEISICAPSSGAGGWGVTTADVMGQYILNGQVVEAGYSVGPYTDDFGGTSSATPLVAGICALLLSINPQLSAQEVKTVIEKTARKIGSKSSYNANGHSSIFGFGCVDAEKAVQFLLN